MDPDHRAEHPGRLRDVRPPFDAHLALWFWTRLIDLSALPDGRIVVRFDLTDGSRPNRYWVLLSRQQAELCVQDPGHTEDLVITTDTVWLVRWQSGQVTLGTAVRSGHFRLEGPRDLAREFARWGGLSPFAHVGRAPAGSPSGTYAPRPGT